MIPIKSFQLVKVATQKLLMTKLFKKIQMKHLQFKMTLVSYIYLNIALNMHTVAHAEYKAILARGAPSFKGCTLYVTKYPCNGCAQVIVQSGITKVYYIEKGTEGDPFTYDQLNSTKKEEWEEKAEQNMYWASGKIFSKNEVKLEPW